MKKTILSLAVIVLIAICGWMPVYAEESDMAPVFALTDAKGSEGDVVQVDLNVRNNPGITAFQIEINYSGSDLELVAADDQQLFANEVTTSQLSSHPFVISWYDRNSDNQTADGTIMTLSFKILQDITASDITIAYDAENVFNSAFENMSFDTQKGQIARDDKTQPGEGDPAQPTVQKSNSSISLKNKTAAYSGKRIAIGKATVKGSTGKVVYTYYTDKACTKGATNKAPIHAGTYYVKAKVAADKNYNSAVSAAAVLKIKKASQNITGVKAKISAKKNYKNAQIFELKGKAKGKVSYKLLSTKAKIKVSSTGKLTVPKKTKKGTYKIKVRITSKATKNYRAKTITKTIKVVVK